MEGTAWRFNRYAERARGERRRPPAPSLRRRRRAPDRDDGRQACAAPRMPAARGASCRWPGRCSSARWRCWPSRTIDTVLVARYGGTRPGGAGGRRRGLHHGVHRPDGRGAGGRADRRPALRRRQAAEAGRQLHQAMWLALALSVLGCALLLFPQPFLRRRARRARGRGQGARLPRRHSPSRLPPALLFTAFRGFNTAVSRPKVVMALQLGGLALKVPLTRAAGLRLAWRTPVGELRLPALGVAGCGIATAIVMWCQWLAARGAAAARPVLRAASDSHAPRAARAARGGAAARCCGWACRWAWRS